MNPGGDFQILNALNTKSDLFLVKHLATEELFVWRTILLKNLSKDKKEHMCKKIRKRIQQKHVLLVTFHPAIEEDKLKLVYVPMEYFPHGNFLDFIKILAMSKTTHINEEIIIKILFQLLMLVKSIELNDYIKLENIYFDENFNIKLLNFSHCSTATNSDVKMSDIGILMMQLCTLTVDKLCNKYTVNKEYYSDDFIDLTEVMLKDNKHVTCNIDKVIGHPVILLNTFKLHCGIELHDCFEILDYRKKVEQLRRKESALKMRENEIKRKECGLNVREKKLIMNEKTIKDKLTQAELYLRRCKDKKIPHPNKYENVDMSLAVEYEEIEDIDNIETSKKLDFSKLKQQPIARTLSERKVKFKGHSPLKKTSFHKSKTNKKPKEKEKLQLPEQSSEMSSTLKKRTIENNQLKEISNVDKTKIDAKCVTVTGENNIPNLQCRPIAWTEQNKKQAFELLRIMNSTSDENFWNSDVRHTFL